MVYLHKKTTQNNKMVYEYGLQEGVYIGSIEFDINDSKKIEDKNPKLHYAEGYSFDRVTSSALQAVAKFIRENSFPENYLRATH